MAKREDIRQLKDYYAKALLEASDDLLNSIDDIEVDPRLKSLNHATRLYKTCLRYEQIKQSERAFYTKHKQATTSDEAEHFYTTYSTLRQLRLDLKGQLEELQNES